jgi:hypothetical protein
MKMGVREFPFEAEAKCDGCGAIGAWDIYGDLLCDKCIESAQSAEAGEKGK